MAKKKASADPLPEAISALSRAMVDQIPVKLHGTAKSPGIFLGSGQKQKLAAALCLENGWLQGTGEFVGTGKSKSETYRITPKGTEFALENAEIPLLLRDLLMANDSQREVLKQITNQLKTLNESAPAQHDLLLQLKQKASIPPETTHSAAVSHPAAATSTDGKWLSQIVEYVKQYRNRNPHRSCPFSELFKVIATPAGITIGQFHDGLRLLARERKITLEPWTRAMSDLENDHLALVQGKETKFYADPV